MSTALEARAEITKLARLLGCETEELSYLQQTGPDALRAVRLAGTDLLFDGDRATMSRLAAGAKLLPAGVLATIAQRTFGPLLCARIAGYIDPGKAVEVAERLPARFLADVSIEIDPRKARVVIGRISPPQAAEVAAILAGEEEYVTMGRFLGHLEDPAIEACLAELPDRALLPIAFVLEAKERLDHVMRMLPDERAARIARLASAEGMWAEALDLAEHVSGEQAARLADIVAAQDDEVLRSLVEAATAAGLWPSLLPLSRVMSLQARRRFARVQALHRPEVLELIVDATLAEDLWPELLPLLEALPQQAQRALAQIASSRPGLAATATRAAVEHGLWPELVTLVPLLGEGGQAEVAEAVGDLSVEQQHDLLAAVGERELWEPLLRIGALLEPGAQERIAVLVASIDETILASLLAAAEEEELWDLAAELLEALDDARLEAIMHAAERAGLASRLQTAFEARAGA